MVVRRYPTWRYEMKMLQSLLYIKQWFLTRGEFPTRGEFEKFKGGGGLILLSENPKHCVLSCSTIRAANFQTLVWDLRLFVILYCRPFYYFFIFAENQNFFAYPITKPPASALKLENLDFILQKLSVTPDKNWKSAPTQLVPPVLGHAYGLR